jgi:hypothetical protein
MLVRFAKGAFTILLYDDTLGDRIGSTNFSFLGVLAFLRIGFIFFGVMFSTLLLLSLRLVRGLKVYFSPFFIPPSSFTCFLGGSGSGDVSISLGDYSTIV